MTEFSSKSLKRRRALVNSCIGECFRIKQKPQETSVDCTFHKTNIKIVVADVGDVVHVIKCTRCCCKYHEFDHEFDHEFVMVELLNGTGQRAHIPVRCINWDAAQLKYKCFLCDGGSDLNFDQAMCHLMACHMQDSPDQDYIQCPGCGYKNSSVETIQKHFCEAHDFGELITFLDRRVKGQLVKYLMIRADEQEKKIQCLEFNLSKKTPNQHDFKEENQLIKEENQHLKEENQHFKEENQHFKEENQHFKEENQHFKEENQHFKEENQHFKEENSKAKLYYIQKKAAELTESYKDRLRNLQKSNVGLLMSTNTLNLELKNAKDEIAVNETEKIKMMAKNQGVMKQLSKVKDSHLKGVEILKTEAKSKEAKIEQLKAKIETLTNASGAQCIFWPIFVRLLFSAK
jgi:hypothetical protein